MNTLLNFLSDRRTLAWIGFFALAALLTLSVQALRVGFAWAIGIALGITAVALALWLWRKRRARRASDAISGMLEEDAQRAVQNAPPAKRAEVEALRKRMLDAVRTIKTSRLGETTGHEALYELPWYLVIGNPAAGKSSAIVNSGLKFPFSDGAGSVIHGIGGTRSCDWFFTSEGILLDTAGRYSIYEEDRSEWLSFLRLLKRHRPKAPVNGIVIAASVAELTQNRPEYAINLARQLRMRIQELSSELGVFAPVYVVFTKTDLVAGFAEFFEDADAAERQRVWGASLPYDGENKHDAVEGFDREFDLLSEGLRELYTSRLALARNGSLGAGVLTFPLEFAAIRQPLRTFIATLFEENPFQFKPIFRGFYFTSALREGTPVSISDRKLASQFSLRINDLPAGSTANFQGSGYFLADLFSKVVFADRNLVKQFTSRARVRLRTGVFVGAVGVMSVALGAWVWAFVANQKLVANVHADLDRVVQMQKQRPDLAARLESLEILQDRLQQLQVYQTSKPLSLGFGLYQGDKLEAQLREEYFKGMRTLLLKPTTDAIEAYLLEVNANGNALSPAAATAESANAASKGTAQQTSFLYYKDLSPTNVEDAYNSLKTYLMLGDRNHLESAHLNDQLTRFWRVWLDSNRGNMPRETMVRSAEHLLNFFLTQINQPDFPTIENRLALVDQVREQLARVVRGMPARERVYAEIKARAATRFPPVSVASIVGEDDAKLISGSAAISGAFTRDAWEKFVQPAIRDAANKDLQSTDWVLKTSTREDLTLQGSPEEIEKALVAMYKRDYGAEWKKLVQGVGVAGFGDFEAAVRGLNRLGDPSTSPLKTLMAAVYRETSWDTPSAMSSVLDQAQNGFVRWFKEMILRQSPAPVAINVATSGSSATGVVGREFSAISALMMPRGEDKSVLMDGYLARLSAVRSRFNQMKTAGDPGPSSRALMQQTFDGNGELAEALRFVDESMLVGIEDARRATIRPLLVRPLMESFAVIVKPVEGEVNKVWQAQVLDPFNQALATKYPFQADSRVEATPTEIAQYFGPDGQIGKFVNSTLGNLVVRRGETFAPRTWAAMGVTLNPEFASSFPRYIAAAGASSTSGAAAEEPQTLFQILPAPAPGVSEYTIDIDGQQLRYRNAMAEWSRFRWPGTGTPGARITAITNDGRSIEVVNFPGRFGLEKLIGSATRERKPNGDFDLSWSAGQASVNVTLRIISNRQAAPAAQASDNAAPQTLRGLKLPNYVLGPAAVTAQEGQGK
ncbi:type VI secretion system membrane subunit TssM [Niveibacterium sp. SC-1]|uniref:type VI secretion system membrane subunit TssM n=1 Tax=Niveibacterium sp. SC-1 TaxID=3135646 RepID=UPI00311E8082